MALGTGARLAAGGGVAAVVVAVAVAFWGPANEPEPAPQQAEPVAVATPVAPADPAPLPPEPPRFDVVRVDAAGLATVAGSAAPDAVVSLQVDGVEAASAKADGSGQFATLFTLSPSEAPRLLSLVMTLADGTTVPGVETVALAPVVAVAAVEPAPAEPAPAKPVAEPAPPAPPAALLVTPEGVEVLQTGTAAVQADVSIDSISYAPDGAVMVGGKGQGGATVRLYLNDAAVADLTVGTDGDWSQTLPAVAPGLYTLRADQIDAAGKVTARFETPFKREAPEALAAAVAEPAPPAAEPVAEPVVEPPAQPAPEPASSPAAQPTAAPEPTPAPTPDAAPVVAAAPITITVQPGLTLWAIAEQNFGEGVMYVQVFEANKDKIKDPDLIYPGQVFNVPKP